MELVEKLETENFQITHYSAGTRRAVIAFASAGTSGPGGAIEEFKGTLGRFDVSVIFVVDRYARWYNYAETEFIFKEVNRMLDDYDAVGSLGESMGGCGAILFSNFSKKISRVLAFSPQFSIMPPFVGFDDRYAKIGIGLPHHYFIDFAQTPIKSNVQILFGNTEWRDLIHRSMYCTCGFEITTVDGASHDVARHLKFSSHGNKLIDVVGYFCDFDNLYKKRGIEQRLGSLITDTPLRDGFGLREERLWGERLSAIARGEFLLHTPDPPALPNVSIGKPATQSSISEWSRDRTPSLDAAGAVSGTVSGNYAFHTAFERSPWWSVDLLGCFAVEEVRLYNYIANPAIAQRAARFELQFALTTNEWVTVHKKNDDDIFGGADGFPFVWRAEKQTPARYVRIRLLTENFLHLDQVEVYGEAINHVGTPNS